jgi:hypothetical protein
LPAGYPVLAALAPEDYEEYPAPKSAMVLPSWKTILALPPVESTPNVPALLYHEMEAPSPIEAVIQTVTAALIDPWAPGAAPKAGYLRRRLI